jgi:ComEC/Rec2-related protein
MSLPALVVVRMAVVGLVPVCIMAGWFLARNGGMKFQRYAMACCVGLLSGMVCHCRAEMPARRNGGGFGADAIAIAAFDGRIVTDPRRTASGLLAYDVEVAHVHGPDGAMASATGRMAVFIRLGAIPTRPVRGTRVLVQAWPQAKASRTDSTVPETATGTMAGNLTVFTSQDRISTIRPASGLQQWRSRARAALLQAFSTTGGAVGPLLEALFLGVRDDLDSDLIGHFRAAGCAHILALSGQHVGILAGLVSLLLGPVLGKRLAGPAAGLLAGLYLFLVGPAPSVVRAIVMFWLATALAATDRPQQPGMLLALTFMIMVLIDPAGFGSLSFKLSFLAVAGITIFARGIAFFLRRWLPPLFAAALAAGIAALAATMPLSIMAFGRINLFSPIISAFGGPLVEAIMWAGALLAGPANLIPILQEPIGWVLYLPYRCLVALMACGARLPALLIDGGTARSLAGAAVVLAVGLVYAIPHVRYHTRRRAEASRHGRNHQTSGL